MTERIKKAVHRQYNCEYPCGCFEDCIFGKGSNTAYDCEECGADEFEKGYYDGAKEQREIDIKMFEDFMQDKIFDLVELQDYERPPRISFKVHAFKTALQELFNNADGVSTPPSAPNK